MDGATQSPSPQVPGAEPDDVPKRRSIVEAGREWLNQRTGGLFLEGQAYGSLPIALLMVVASIATGPVTYFATQHVHRAIELEDAGLHQTIEAGYVERIVRTKVDHEALLHLNLARHEALQQAHLDAETMDPADLAHEFGVQSEHDQGLAVSSGFRWQLPQLTAQGTTAYNVADAEQALEADAGTRRVFEPGAGSAALAGVERETALRLVTIIIAIVFALVLFTIAQVTRRPRLRLVSAAVAFGLAIGAFVAVMDYERGWLAMAVGVGAPVLFLAIAAGAAFRHVRDRSVPDEDLPELITEETGAEGPKPIKVVHPAELGSRFARFIALAIALATLCGAWIAYLQTDAFGRADAFRVEGQANGIDASVAGEQAFSQVLRELAVYNAAIEADSAVRSGEQVARFEEHARSEPGHHAAETTVDHLVAVATRLHEAVQFKEQAYAPGVDPDFPIGILANASREHDRLSALELMDDDDSRDWINRAADYVLLLVLLALAVYLLGLAVVLRNERIKLTFFVVGGTGIVMAFVIAFISVQNHPDSPAHGGDPTTEQAAQAFADGRFEMAMGHYDAARVAFERSVALRSDFGQGHADLAEAWYLSGSSQADPPGYVSLSSPTAVTNAIAEEEEAMRHGIASYAVSADLGYERVVGALGAGDRSRLDDLLKASLESSAAASAYQPDEAVPYFNMALAHLVAGDTNAAATAYTAAIERTSTHDPLSSEQSSLLSAGLTDLEVVRFSRPDLADRVRASQERLVAELGDWRSRGTRPIHATSITVEVTPTTLTWAARMPDLDPAADAVNQVWFFRPDPSQPWAVYDRVEPVLVGGNFAELIPQSSGSYLGRVSHPIATSHCLPDGQYRVDLYVNGALAGRSDAAEHVGGAAGARKTWWARDIGILSCVPRDWVQAAVADDGAGIFDAAVSRNHASGLVVGRIQFAGVPDAAARSSAVLAWIRSSGLGPIPGGLGPLPAALDPGGVAAPPARFEIGLDGEQAETWHNDTTEFRAHAAVTPEGTVLVAVLFGPKGFLASNEAGPNPIGDAYLAMGDLWGLGEHVPLQASD